MSFSLLYYRIGIPPLLFKEFILTSLDIAIAQGGLRLNL